MLHVFCSKFSQLSNSEIFFENLSTIDKVTICNEMSSFFGPPCIMNINYQRWEKWYKLNCSMQISWVAGWQLF